jgi:AcrR family transcriptional regulator
MTTTTPGRLQQKKARTRAAITAAASQLFHEQGFEATSIHQIAEVAETGVGTVYGYFKSKDEMLREVLRLRSEAEIAAFRSGLSADTGAVDVILDALGRLRSYVEQNRELVGAALHLALTSGQSEEPVGGWLVQAFELLLRRGIDRGEIRPLDVSMVSRILMGAALDSALGIGSWAGFGARTTDVDELRSALRALLSP